MILIEPVDDENHKNTRLISFLPRNKKEDHVYAVFSDEGLLEPAVPERPTDKLGITSAEVEIPKILKAELVPGAAFDYRACLAKVTATGFSRSTFDRWLARQIEDSVLIREKKGIYAVHRDFVPEFGNGYESKAEENHHKEGETIHPEALERREDAQVPEKTGSSTSR